MDKRELLKTRILEAVKDVKEQTIATELMVLFNEYEAETNKLMKEMKKLCKTKQLKSE